MARAKADPRGIPWHWTWDRSGKLIRVLYMDPIDWERYCAGLPPRPHMGYAPEEAEPAGAAGRKAGVGSPDATGNAWGPGEPGRAGDEPAPTPRIRRGGIPQDRLL